MKRIALASMAVCVCVVVSCSDEGEDNSGSTSSSASSAGASGGSGGSETTGGGGSGTGGTASGPRHCARTCATPADCANDNANPPFDGDNWTCDGGVCEWKGCLGDEECDFFGGVCRPGGPVTGPVDACTEACTDVSVCVENLASVDLDNWACRGGGCEYTGCLSDDECVTDYGMGSRCLPGADGGPASCATGCSTPADCVVENTPPTHDEDNWECTDGLCVYAGCTSDEECTEASGGPSVCVAPD